MNDEEDVMMIRIQLYLAIIVWFTAMPYGSNGELSSYTCKLECGSS